MTQLSIFEPGEAYHEKKKLYEIAEIDLIYKPKVKPSDRPSVTSAADAYAILMKVWDDNKIDLCEDAKVIHLSRANKVLGVQNLSRGGVSGTVVDPKLIFAAALRANASGIILAHNHPSGNLKPSTADCTLTKELKQAGAFMQVPLVDSMIITRDGYTSLAEHGLV